MNTPGGRVEVYYYVAAHPKDAGHVTVVGDTKRSLMYWDSDGRRGGGWERDPACATRYSTRREATDAALLLAAQQPQYLGKLKIKRWRYVWQPAPPNA